MATIAEIISLIDKTVENFNQSVPAIQQQLFDEITELASQLDTKKGRIKATARNIKLIAQIKLRFEKLITKNKGYIERVKIFTDTFKEVSQLQTQYFTETIQKFSPPKTLEAIRQESIESTIDSLRGNGMRAKLIDPVRDILRTNITSGAKFTDLTKGLREFLLDTKNGEGELVKYTKQITSDALHGYARTNLVAVTDDLGLEWFSYNGGLIESSRPFCVALTKKKYFHKSEIPDLIKGNFAEFKAIDGRINPKTGLPDGFFPETTADTFLTECGGFMCRHQAIPVDELAVPERIKSAL